MAHLYGGDLGQEVVGESHYIETLARCFEAGRKDHTGKRSYTQVEIRPESNNPHDKNAVAIIGQFGKVGHLSRTDAKRYRQLYGSTDIHTTDAVIITHDGTLFGVWLDISLDETFVKQLRSTLSQEQPQQSSQAIKPGKQFFARLFNF